MGMFTEFYFRAEVKDGPCADWLDAEINGNQSIPWQIPSCRDLVHEWFNNPQWYMVFCGGGAVYQQSRPPLFTRDAPGGPYGNRLTLSSSAKTMLAEEFVQWITPHLKMSDGDFLGYSLYEDTTDDDSRQWREHPTLFFVNRKPVRS